MTRYVVLGILLGVTLGMAAVYLGVMYGGDSLASY
jgi:hypothetical protein